MEGVSDATELLLDATLANGLGLISPGDKLPSGVDDRVVLEPPGHIELHKLLFEPELSVESLAPCLDRLNEFNRLLAGPLLDPILPDDRLDCDTPSTDGPRVFGSCWFVSEGGGDGGGRGVKCSSINPGGSLSPILLISARALLDR